MKFTVLTLFPETVQSALSGSIIGRAIANGKFELEVRNLRDWATDKHKTVDDTPYGGGPGMLLKVEVIDRALSDLRTPQSHVILLTPQGQRFNQQKAEILSQKKHVVLIAGHYEGFDERVRLLVDEQISIGDFVLTGGEFPAITIVDAVARLLPEVLGDNTSKLEESFSLKDNKGDLALEYPHYTRPEKFTPVSKPELGELVVPDVLLSGDHGKIDIWRRQNIRKP